MLTARIAVVVSGGGTNLQALIDTPITGGEIAAVISSNPGAYALERAKKAGVPGYVLEKKNFDNYTKALLEKLQELRIDLVVMAGFMTIVTKELFEVYENAVINVHPSLIRSFCGGGCCGLHVNEQALAYGVKVTGATVHLVTAEPDGGPIVLQKAIDILPWDTPESLQRRVMEECEWKLLPKAVDLLCRDNLKVEGRTVNIIGGRVIV